MWLKRALFKIKSAKENTKQEQSKDGSLQNLDVGTGARILLLIKL